MSQWDGLPEAPPPMDMLGKLGKKAQMKVIDAVTSAQKPRTDEQLRAIHDAKAAMVVEVVNDPEFDPDARVAEIEGRLVEHLEALDGLLGELASWRGALKWSQNVVQPYRPVPASSRGPAVQFLRRDEIVSAASLVAALREALGVTAVAPVHVDRYGRAAA
jgi:hypothetical protein